MGSAVHDAPISLCVCFPLVLLLFSTGLAGSAVLNGSCPATGVAGDGDEAELLQIVGSRVSEEVYHEPMPLFMHSPFLMSHDAATGYMGDQDARRPLYNTQYANPLSQLNCGARALDIRLVQQMGDGGSSSIHMLHGPSNNNPLDEVSWVSDQTLNDLLSDVKKWARAHSSELVLLVISHCQLHEIHTYRGRPTKIQWSHLGCDAAPFAKVFRENKIQYSKDCNNLKNKTLEEVKRAVDSSQDGLVLAIDSKCVTDNCHGDIIQREKVLPDVVKTLNDNAAPFMFQLQAFRQQRTDGIIGIHDVPIDSEVNKLIFDAVAHDQLPGVNLLEVNTVCAYGPEISKLLGAKVTPEDEHQCHLACGMKKLGEACNSDRDCESFNCFEPIWGIGSHSGTCQCKTPFWEGDKGTGCPPEQMCYDYSKYEPNGCQTPGEKQANGAKCVHSSQCISGCCSWTAEGANTCEKNVLYRKCVK